MWNRFLTIKQEFLDSNKVLDQLSRNHGHDVAYFADQWARKRASQMELMASDNSSRLIKKLEELVQLEETLRGTQ